MSNEKTRWYQRQLLKFGVPRPKVKPQPSGENEINWNVKQSVIWPDDATDYDRAPIVSQEDRPNTSNKKLMWYIIGGVIVTLILLAVLGVLIYFTVCHWAGSCGGNTATTTVPPPMQSTTTYQCLNFCLNTGTCDTDAHQCECPNEIKTDNCYCNNVIPCCGNSSYTISDNGGMMFTISKMVSFASGTCRWNFYPNMQNGAQLSFVRNLLTFVSSDCNKDFVAIYNNTVVFDDLNLVGRYCMLNQSQLTKIYGLSTMALVWSSSTPNQNLQFTISEITYDYCETSPCGDNSTCTSTNSNFVCLCPDGYFGGGPGTPCRPETICDLEPPVCQNSGNCSMIDDNNNKFKCFCPTSYSGIFCEAAIS